MMVVGPVLKFDEAWPTNLRFGFRWIQYENYETWSTKKLMVGAFSEEVEASF